jgi:hypothetical protein
MLLKNIGAVLMAGTASLSLVAAFQTALKYHNGVFQHFHALDAVKPPIVVEAHSVERFLVGAIVFEIVLIVYFGFCSYTLFLSAKADARRLSRKE